MQWLIAAIMTLLGSVVDFFIKISTRKIAGIVLFLAVFVSLTTAFITAINGLYGLIAMSIPYYIQVAMSWILPTNTGTCISVYVSASAAKWVYRKNLEATGAMRSSGYLGGGS